MKTQTNSQLFLKIYDAQAPAMAELVSRREEEGDRIAIQRAKDFLYAWDALRRLALVGGLD